MISYSVENTGMPRIKKRLVERWVEAVLKERGYELGEVNYRFVDDTTMLKENQRYLGHDFYTDILTFENRPFGVSEKVIYGDIIISTDRVKENARNLKVSYQEELHRVLIHGMLHLCGLNDITPEEEKKMHLAEDKALQLLHTIQ